MKNNISPSQSEFLHSLFNDLCKITNAISIVQESSHVDDVAGDTLTIIIRDLCTNNEQLSESFGFIWQGENNGH